ncbi:hypothetical protein [Rossellomorea marisflavi]|uniref:Uncharacterized protein n=1 Tax=Rossellomorea marisflavi TaxID=189381 RepID=A0A0J5SS52_9BACI|nr:hypothetical protein [Rossellomorea marisflavi]KML00071.1 hypothetical protein VL06_21120 [Rossellomorea marisflavi]KML33879.1 hypothetical protein VL12_07690 [Rossellomorea marisflavi]KZE50536.1 hypothetical protein AV649_17630 [Rossellomorea marisflavi]MBV6684538.1 hypothetical protein [Bacillus sp. JRC01]
MKKHPERVQFAVPVDDVDEFEWLSSKPYFKLIGGRGAFHFSALHRTPHGKRVATAERNGPFFHPYLMKKWVEGLNVLFRGRMQGFNSDEK